MVGTRSTKEATLWLSGSGSLDLNWWPRVSRWCAIYIQLLWCSADNWGNFVCKKGKQRMIGWVVQEALTVAATLALATKVTNTTDSLWICDAPAGLSIRAITCNTCYSWVMFNGPLMSHVNWPVVDSIHPLTASLTHCVKITATGDSKCIASCAEY